MIRSLLCVLLFSLIFSVRADVSFWCDSELREDSLRESLNGFYLETSANSWKHDYLWGSDECPCSWFGVDCESSNTTVKLELSSNEIEGTFSENFCANIYSVINLSNNELYSTLPSCLGNMTSLTSLKIANNSLQGIVPESLGNLENLKHLDIHNNFFAGPFPSFINCPNRYYSNKIDLSFKNNQFWCPAPEWCDSDKCSACEPEPSDFCTNQNVAACEILIGCCYENTWSSECNDLVGDKLDECEEVEDTETCDYNPNGSSDDSSTIWWVILAIAIAVVILAIGGSVSFVITMQKKEWSFRKVRNQLVKVDSETYMIDPSDSIYQDDVPPRSSLDFEL